MVKLYAAPLEGVTGYVWRNAHRQIFGGADKYYTPFIAPNKHLCFQTKELRDITQEEENLVPQLLTFNAEHFIWAAREMQFYGYNEVNLNLGCPSGTVVAKEKGSGALRDPIRLNWFLDDIFEVLTDMKISVKTRIGLNSEEEWPAILAVFEQYPICELTVHPRLRVQQYKGLANRELFKDLMSSTKLPLVYNGDVYKEDDEAFSWGCPVMSGRGLITDPALFRKAKGGKAASREEFIAFHEALVEGYRGYMSGEVPLIHRVKELWSYMLASFETDDSVRKRMLKAKTYAEYAAVANDVLYNAPLKK